MTDLAQLMQRLVEVCADFEQTIDKKVIDQWRKRLTELRLGQGHILRHVMPHTVLTDTLF